jgi:hypothetical protein
MILPLAAIFFVAVHFWRIRKDGGLYAHSSEPAVLRTKAKTVWTEIPPKPDQKFGSPETTEAR